MVRVSMTLLIASLIAVSAAIAEDSQSSATARARAALALAQVELATPPAPPVSPAAPAPAPDRREVQTLAAAKLVAQRSGRVVFVRCGSLDCSPVCEALTTTGVVCHASAEPQNRFLVLAYSARDSSYYYHEWATPPSHSEAIEQAEKVRAAAGLLDWGL